jgi:hypothetical protein
VTDPECLARLFVNHSIRKLRLMQQYLEICVAEVDASMLGGLPDIWNRKAEFEEQPVVAKDGLLLLLRNTVDEAVAIISGIDSDRLATGCDLQLYRAAN